MSSIYKLKPVLKDYIWGGERLKKDYSKESDHPIAESWELSVYPDGQSEIIEDNKIIELSQFIKEHPEVFGENYQLPVLIKLIDAADNLSVQVHPDDKSAALLEGESGKNEFWIILQADKDAFIYYGLKEKLSRDELKKAIEDNKVEEYLNKIPVRAGQSFFIPAGTLHAIGKGCLVFEISQNSNITYRLYDYNRTDQEGNPRELHIDKGLSVANLEPIDDSQKSGEGLIYSNYFNINDLELSDDSVEIKITSNSFLYLFCRDGNLEIKTENSQAAIKKGESVLILTDSSFKISGSGSCYIIDLIELKNN